jgi:hypothetical protein
MVLRSLNLEKFKIQGKVEVTLGFHPMIRRVLSPFRSLLVPVYEYVIRVSRRLDPGLMTFRDATGRTLISTDQFRTNSKLAVLLGVGASNIANEGDPDGRYVPASGVFNFNFFDGRIYQARDPLLGATLDRSNVFTRVGARLVAAGLYERVLLVPIAHGGTFIAEWVPGGRMHPRLARTIKMLRRRGIAVTHVLWQQGEAEASTPSADPTDWANHFRDIASVVRDAFAGSIFFVAQCTICCNDPNEVIRAAQRSVVDPKHGILPGPDLDAIGREQRWDDCHFSIAGLERAADLWLAAFKNATIE